MHTWHAKRKGSASSIVDLDIASSQPKLSLCCTQHCETLRLFQSSKFPTYAATKQCARADHLWLEDMSINKARNFCEVWICIDESVYEICRHNPQCKPTMAMYRNMLTL
jgi:hypothetical protein